MVQPRSLPRKESLFLWSSQGVHRIRKKIRETIKRVSSNVFDWSSEEEKTQRDRRYPRLDLKMPILYKIVGQNESRLPPEIQPFLLAESQNISPIGLCLNLEENLPKGTVLALKLRAGPAEEFAAVGRVLWVQPAEDPQRFLVGLQFVVVEGDSVVREAHSRLESMIQKMEEVPAPI